MQHGEGFAVSPGGDAPREFADPGVGLRQRAVAQKQARREAFDCAADDAVGILRLDLTVDLDAQLVERAVG